MTGGETRLLSAPGLFLFVNLNIFSNHLRGYLLYFF